jgi:hypothetical protein
MIEWDRLVDVLRGDEARALCGRIFRDDNSSFNDGGIWSHGFCLVLAVSLGEVLKKDIILMIEEDDDWCHAAVLLSDETTILAHG